MKICILTNYSTTLNYGAILQAYALNKAVNRLGAECETVDYIGSGSVSHAKQSELVVQKIRQGKPLELIDAVIKRTKKRMVAPQMNSRRQAFKSFRNSIPHTEKCTGDDYQNVVNRYDCAICGSDQIWRPSQAGDLVDAFWLTGIDSHVRKIAYAASMGVDRLPSHCEDKARCYLESFSNIGVREESAREYYSKLTTREDIEVVPDPVFLLERNDWERLADKREETSDTSKYILVYMIHGTKRLLDGIEEYADRKGMRIISFPFMNYQYSTYQAKYGHERDCFSTPEEWLGLLKNAEFVFTDSFHACAFSILLRKRFFVSSSNKKAFSRIKTLVDSCGVQGRVIPAEGLSPEKYDAAPDVDWELVEERVNGLRLQGISFLEKSVRRD